MLKEILEKRKYPRINFHTSVSYQCKGQPQLDYTLSKDLSEGGMGITLNRFIPKDAELLLEFSLKEHSEPLRAKAKLAWIQKLPYAQRYRAGLEFQYMDSVYKINLKRFFNKEPFISTAYA